ncbi:hypothetical protein V1293_007258 [Bradyrhizobium sp. AZCC 1693]
MKSLSTRSFITGSAICMAFAALDGAALAESLGYQCRAAVRAEMKGPDCRMALPPSPTSHCNIPANAEVEVMDNKINECVKRGGPRRQSKTGS